MRKLTEKFPTEKRNRNRFKIEDDLAKWSSEELLEAVNAVMKALQSSDELLDVNWLSFDLRQKFGCYFDDSLVWVAVKYLSNEGYIKLDMSMTRTSRIKEKLFESWNIVEYNSTARFMLGSNGQIMEVKDVQNRKSIGRKDRTFRGENWSKKRLLTRGHARLDISLEDFSDSELF